MDLDRAGYLVGLSRIGLEWDSYKQSWRNQRHSPVIQDI